MGVRPNLYLIIGCLRIKQEFLLIGVNSQPPVKFFYQFGYTRSLAAPWFVVVSCLVLTLRFYKMEDVEKFQSQLEKFSDLTNYCHFAELQFPSVKLDLSEYQEIFSELWQATIQNKTRSHISHCKLPLCL